MKYKKKTISIASCVLFCLGQALEYARTIAKPKVSPRPKKEDGAGAQAKVRMQTETRYLSGVDVGHLTLLESLRQRHEQEKRAVSQFKAIHVV